MRKLDDDMRQAMADCESLVIFMIKYRPEVVLEALRAMRAQDAADAADQDL